MTAFTYGISQTSSMPVLYPSYQIGFTYDGNSYGATLVLNTTAAADSADWDTTVEAMLATLGEGYTDVYYNRLAIDDTTGS